MSDILEGSQKGKALARRSIATDNHIPNIAIFLKRTTIEFLQILFSQRAPGSLQYLADDTKTEIQISDQHAINLDADHVRPAIVAVRGPLTWSQIGLGGNSTESIHIPTRKSVSSDLLTGSVAFSCLSREGVEAEQIAHLVFNSFKLFRPVLQKYGFFSIKSLNIGAETLIVQDGDNDDLHLVPVYITAAIQDRWSLDDDTKKRLEKIIIEQQFCP